MKSDSSASSIHWSESNKFWGSSSAGLAILLVVAATVLRDLTWLLWVAAAFFVIPAYVVTRLMKVRWLGWVSFGVFAVLLVIVTGVSYTYAKNNRIPLAVPAQQPSAGSPQEGTGTTTSPAGPDINKPGDKTKPPTATATRKAEPQATVPHSETKSEQFDNHGTIEQNGGCNVAGNSNSVNCTPTPAPQARGPIFDHVSGIGGRIGLLNCADNVTFKDSQFQGTDTAIVNDPEGKANCRSDRDLYEDLRSEIRRDAGSPTRIKQDFAQLRMRLKTSISGGTKLQQDYRMQDLNELENSVLSVAADREKTLDLINGIVFTDIPTNEQLQQSSNANSTNSASNLNGSIVNQNSPNYGSQTVYNAPQSRSIDVAKFAEEIGGVKGSVMMIKAGTSEDIGMLLNQLQDAFHNAHWSLSRNDAFSKDGRETLVDGLECYSSSVTTEAFVMLQTAFAEANLRCKPFNHAYVNGLSFGSDTITVLVGRNVPTS